MLSPVLPADAAEAPIAAAMAGVSGPLVVGAGPAGCCLAALLADQGWPVTLLEAGSLEPAAREGVPAAGANGAGAQSGTGMAGAAAEGRPSLQRTLALAAPGWAVLGRLGITPARLAARPIRTIHVSYRGQPGRVCLQAAESGLDCFGHTVAYRDLLEALRAAVQARPLVTLHDRASVLDVTGATSAARVRWQAPDGVRQDALVPLAVLADGGALAAGQASLSWRYRQQALACVVTTDQPVGDVAYERFTADGPIALLPCATGYALVWTAPARQIDMLLAAADDAFLVALQAAFGDRSGRFVACSPRQRYPLQGRFALRPAHRRVARVANAAQSLHPVAGQGFNLGLRDVDALLSLLGAASPGKDAGAPERLLAYAAARRPDRWTTGAITHLLAAAFALPGSGLPASLALTAFDLGAPLRRQFARLMAEGLGT